MRSVRDLVRTYVHVNQGQGPRNPIRFGSLLIFVAVLATGFWWFAGAGPTFDPGGSGDPVASEGQAGEATTLQTRALPGGGVYVGYPQDAYDPAYAAFYDVEEAADLAMAYYLDHADMAPPQVVTMDDGAQIGYAVRPLT